MLICILDRVTTIFVRKIRAFAFILVSLSLVQAGLTHARGPDYPIEFERGSLVFEVFETRYDTVNPDATKTKTDRTGGQRLWLDFNVNALGFAGELKTNHLFDSAESDFKFRYGDRLTSTGLKSGGDRSEIYSFSASHLGDEMDTHIFYHVPRYHWGYEGDSFGLLHETTNMDDQDIWNEKAPAGVEFVGKGSLDGLKVLAGREIYWGAHPMVLAKYQFGEGGAQSLLVERDIADDVERKRFTVQGSAQLRNSTKLLFGLLSSGREKIGNLYNYEVSEGVIAQRGITGSDTWAAKLRVEEDVGSASVIWLELNKAGLVAERGEQGQEVWDSEIPYSSLGNKQTLEVGGRFVDGSFIVSPRIFVRKTGEDALSLTARGDGRTGTVRESQATTFAVQDNRDANAAEIYFTYDPTPGTFFYEWDNPDKEDAKFAANLGIMMIEFLDRTDMRRWPWGYDWGRAPEKVEKIVSRFVYKATPDLRINGKIESGHQMSLFGGDNGASNLSRFSSIESRFIYRTKNIVNLVYKTDAYGEYDWHSEYGTSYPRSIELGYERLLDDRAKPSKLGLKLFRRDLEPVSGGEYQNGANEHMSEVQLYYEYSF
jgi:hypothetical protein